VQSRTRNLVLAASALGVAVAAGLTWSLGAASIARRAWPEAAVMPVPRPTPLVEPLVLEDHCGFLKNGDYVCAGPVSAPRCGLAAVEVEWQTAKMIVGGELGWIDEPKLTEMVTIEDTAVVVGLERTSLDLAFPFHRTRPASPVTVDLSDVDVTISAKPSFDFEAEFAKTSASVQVLGRQREESSVAMLVVHCHWPPTAS
jgi:hypothetical protein